MTESDVRAARPVSARGSMNRRRPSRERRAGRQADTCPDTFSAIARQVLGCPYPSVGIQIGAATRFGDHAERRS
jgi:hypothetical protein